MYPNNNNNNNKIKKKKIKSKGGAWDGRRETERAWREFYIIFFSYLRFFFRFTEIES